MLVFLPSLKFQEKVTHLHLVNVFTLLSVCVQTKLEIKTKIILTYNLFNC